MRVGQNPLKSQNNLNKRFLHRIIVTVFIPDSSDEYYINHIKTLDKCLESLVKTIDFRYTCITVINNNSGAKTLDILSQYNKYFDKIVNYSNNKGKVYAILQEAKASFEDYITITDCDILFLNNWENEVFSIFRNFKKAGAVSPMPLPYLTFHFNNEIFFDSVFSRKIKKGKYVKDYDIDLYLKGTNLPNLCERKNSIINWRESQYVIENENQKAVIGAYHVVTTFKRHIFNKSFRFPEKVFENSYESYFIDNLTEKSGLYKLSTISTYAYHIGNYLDDFAKNYLFNEEKIQFSIPVLNTQPTILSRIFKENLLRRRIGKLISKIFYNGYN